MILKLRVITRARKNSITIDDDGTVRIHTTAVPVKGQANAIVTEMLSKHYGVPKNSIKFIRGQVSHDKLVEIQ